MRKFNAYKWVIVVLILIGSGLLLFRGERVKLDSGSKGQRLSGTSGLEFSPSSPSRSQDDSFAAGKSLDRRPAFQLSSAQPSSTAIWKSDTPAAHRAGVVEVYADLLQQVPLMKIGDVLNLQLFEDVSFSAVLTDVTVYINGGVGMTGRLEGDYAGQVFVTYSSDTMMVSTEIYGNNNFYVQYDSASGKHIAIEIDSARSDRKNCPTCAKHTDVLKNIPASSDQSYFPSAIPIAQSDSTDNVTIDLLIVYSTDAANYTDQGGRNIIQNINMAMQRANTAHENSDTRVTLNLVHSEEVAYSENINDMGEDLDNLTDGINGLGYAHTLRETYKADFVSLITRSDNSGGLAWLLNNTIGREDRAFNVSRVEQTAWTYTMVHEIGHNMGCGHSATQWTQEGPGLEDYSSGWQWADASSSASVGYCSVMTYENFDGVSGDEYNRVGYFSNPSKSYNGNATGDASYGDNARTIRDMRFIFQDYRVRNPDADDDGMLDDWEILYLGGTSAVATADFDLDGQDNLSEYIGGTLPNDSESVFEILSSELGTGTGISYIITWDAVEGRVYDVKLGHNLLLDNFSTSLSGELPYPINAYTDRVSRPNPSVLYRLDVKLDED